VKRVPVPEKYFVIESNKTARQVFNAFALWLVPAVLSYFAFINNENQYFGGVVVLLSAWISGHGLQCVALLGHEGTHFTLHKDRWTSAFMGVLLSSFAPFHMDVGFAISHAEHHAFTNTDKDPDHIFFGHFKNFWSRLLLARSAASRRYLFSTLKLAFGRWPPDHPIRIGLTSPELVRLARLNLLSSFSLLALYLTATFFFPVAMICILWVPFLIAMLISGLRPFVEHVETKVGRGHDSRSWISPYFDALYGSINYHQAHHLWPRVPAYNLKSLHHWMRDNNAGIDQHSIEISSIAEFIKVAKRFPDPFL
jgi:fatty acid desaturase